MRLAPDPFVIRIGGESVTLSLSLRAATRIAAKHGDFPTVLRGVLDGNLSMIGDLITEGTGNHNAAVRLFDLIAKVGVRTVLNDVAVKLTDYVLALAGYDPDAPARTEQPASQPLTIAEYHARLFEFATGWLGWSPEQAWSATTAEIEAAFKGHTDKLKAIHGTGGNSPAMTAEQRAEIEAKGMDPEFDRAGLHALKSKNRVK